MSHRVRALVLGALALALCIPAGFAVAQVAINDSPPSGEPSFTDPDPSTDPVEIMKDLDQAHAEGNEAAEAEGVAAVRQEILSRMSEADREAAEKAPPEPNVPPGTKSYIPPNLPTTVVERCEAKIEEGTADDLCQLIVLHAEGKIRSGAFSPEEQRDALEGNE